MHFYLTDLGFGINDATRSNVERMEESRGTRGELQSQAINACAVQVFECRPSQRGIISQPLCNRFNDLVTFHGSCFEVSPRMTLKQYLLRGYIMRLYDN